MKWLSAVDLGWDQTFLHVISDRRELIGTEDVTRWDGEKWMSVLGCDHPALDDNNSTSWSPQPHNQASSSQWNTHTHIVVWLTCFKRDFYIISHVVVSHQVSVNMCLGVSHADSLHALPRSRQRWAKDSVILSPLLTHLLRWMDNVLLMQWLRLIHLITQCNQTDPWEIKLFPRFIPAPVCSLLLFSAEC